jgi:P27 family predicted phage terminase small subunit
LKPPSHLPKASRAWFEAVATSYQLEPHHFRILQLAAEAWDRAGQARRILARDGIVYYDKAGQPRKHPMISVEENARLQFARLVRELALEEEPPDSRLPRSRRYS